jgi:hypothetical protein
MSVLVSSDFLWPAFIALYFLVPSGSLPMCSSLCSSNCSKIVRNAGSIFNLICHQLLSLSLIAAVIVLQSVAPYGLDVSSFFSPHYLTIMQLHSTLLPALNYLMLGCFMSDFTVLFQHCLHYSKLATQLPLL